MPIKDYSRKARIPMCLRQLSLVEKFKSKEICVSAEFCKCNIVGAVEK